MGKNTIRLGSVTYAIKVRKLLAKELIKCDLIKMKDPKENGGCSYGISFRSDKLLDVIALLKQNGISYSLVND